VVVTESLGGCTSHPGSADLQLGVPFGVDPELSISGSFCLSCFLHDNRVGVAHGYNTSLHGRSLCNAPSHPHWRSSLSGTRLMIDLIGAVAGNRCRIIPAMAALGHVFARSGFYVCVASSTTHVGRTPFVLHSSNTRSLFTPTMEHSHNIVAALSHSPHYCRTLDDLFSYTYIVDTPETGFGST
jgi:hypothetical protein